MRTTWGLVAGEDSRIRMLDRTMDRMEYVEGRQKVKDQYAKWKDTTAVLIEDSSSGTAIISDLRTTGIPLLPISAGVYGDPASASCAVHRHMKQRSIAYPVPQEPDCAPCRGTLPGSIPKSAT